MKPISFNFRGRVKVPIGAREGLLKAAEMSFQLVLGQLYTDAVV